jgi:KRAB domain-containing zinc finger protein
VSQDLTHHLIEHSDQSTAAKRVQPTGPRKYKRRRKLSEDVPSTSSSAIMDIKFTPRTKAIKQEPIDSPPTSPNKKGLLTMSFALFDAPKKIVEFELPDEIFETVSRERKEQKKVTNVPSTSSILGGTSTRPRMIFTEKTRVPIFDGKRKSRTMIQKQILGGSKRNNKRSSNFTKSREFVMAKKRKEDTQVDQEEGNGSETCSNEDEDVLKVLLKRERKLSEKFTVDLVNDLHEILRSPLKLTEKIIQDDEEEIEIDQEDILESSPSSSVRRSVRKTPSRYGSNRKVENKRIHIELDDDVLMLEEEEEDIIVKEEIFDGQTCQICGDTFESREQLLSHVPIHI